MHSSTRAALITASAALGLCGLIVPQAGAQVTSLPFDFVDVAASPLAPDYCGVNFTYTDVDNFSGSDAAGVSIADFDNDGFLDIFFPSSNGVANKLYKNTGGMAFTDVAAARGVSDAASAAGAALFIDYDHDGDLDLFTSQHLGKPGFPLGPRFKLFRNQGSAGSYSFSDVTSTAGFALGSTPKLTNWGLVSGICAGDYNHDGWVDIFTSWNAQSYSSQDQWRLMRNAPNPTPGDPNDPSYTPRIFIDATPLSGIQGEFGGNPWQPQFWDVNRDGWPDLHIAQDMVLDLMFINNKNGTFTNVATPVGLNGNPPEGRSEMGSALADPDNDLDEDLHSTNIGYLDRFYRNDSIGSTLSFTDTAIETGLNDSVYGWGTTFVDVDNDGDLDHAAVTGFDHDMTKQYFNPVHLNLYPERLRDGLTTKWENVSALLTDFSRTNTPNGDLARGLAAGDLDNDGDVDLIVTRNADPARVMKNTLASDNRWLEVRLVNTAGSLDTTGTRVYVKDNSVIRMREVFTGSSYLCQESPRLHFGLGPAGPVADVPPSTGPFKTAGVHGAQSSGGATSAGPGVGPQPADETPVHGGSDWLVVRWWDGSCQFIKEPAANAILTLNRAAIDDVGDLDTDGHLTALDQALLLLAISDLPTFEALHPRSPARILGDVDNNGLLDAADLTAWSALPPH